MSNNKSFIIDDHSALLVIDIQFDFLPGGALSVPDGDKIITNITDFISEFHKKKGKIIFTQDWHPKGHFSFASAHEGKKPGDLINDLGLGPILWPDHCVQGSHGAKIHPDLPTDLAIAIIRKGCNQKIDSYSAFLENDHQTSTGLTGLLKDLEITKVFICGLALDYCCYFSAVDAKHKGFDVFFVENLTKGIDQPENSIENALRDMKERGIHIITY
ncbi:MAG: bifunctional nicotinamidase/pyrazinamidase [Promethearchaeia archaeon]|nr:MAG: bifunctional nicotinamidase/pyrazinamidase [Candidatus Lokiarchaeia archaeon]